tara:strand:- start:151544 stop:151804 length:261 start_codon:yes stop_codon:yes gene_type:complete
MGNYQEDEYVVFMKEYRLEHKLCPKCGSSSHTSTLVAYSLDLSNKSVYKDRNGCTCSDCGDNHETHDRVNRQKIRNKTIKKILKEI